MNHSDHPPHDHSSHDHLPPPDEGQQISDIQYLEIALRELLIEKGVINADEIRAGVEALDAVTTAQGARVVARAWCDDQFRQRLLADGSKACMELGIDIRPTRLVVVENTDSWHNVIVCTLCSCYPRLLLGLPPDWYKSREYRSRVVKEPRKVLAEFGTQLSAGVSLRVHDSTADMRYLVLPLRPTNSEHLDEEQLAALVTRDSMIGVTLVQSS